MASRPYRDYRPVWLAAVTIGLVTLVLMVNNARTAYRFFINTHDTRAEITQVESEIAGERAKSAEIDQRTQSLDSSLLRARVAYVNNQIVRRAFSWSALLDHLEEVFPDEVRLVTLNPVMVPERPVQLNMTCVGRTGDGLVELIRALNDSQHFAKPLPTSESLLEDGSYRFTINVEYLAGQTGGTR